MAADQVWRSNASELMLEGGQCGELQRYPARPAALRDSKREAWDDAEEPASQLLRYFHTLSNQRPLYHKLHLPTPVRSAMGRGATVLLLLLHTAALAAAIRRPKGDAELLPGAQRNRCQRRSLNMHLEI